MAWVHDDDDDSACITLTSHRYHPMESLLLVAEVPSVSSELFREDAYTSGGKGGGIFRHTCGKLHLIRTSAVMFGRGQRNSSWDAIRLKASVVFREGQSPNLLTHRGYRCDLISDHTSDPTAENGVPREEVSNLPIHPTLHAVR